MSDLNPSLPNDTTELVDDAPAIDMDALAEKILALLRKEIEIETERCGDLFAGRR
jgi:hypothetical protein